MTTFKLQTFKKELITHALIPNYGFMWGHQPIFSSSMCITLLINRASMFHEDLAITLRLKPLFVEIYGMVSLGMHLVILFSCLG